MAASTEAMALIPAPPTPTRWILSGRRQVDRGTGVAHAGSSQAAPCRARVPASGESADPGPARARVSTTATTAATASGRPSDAAACPISSSRAGRPSAGRRARPASRAPRALAVGHDHRPPDGGQRRRRSPSGGRRGRRAGAPGPTAPPARSARPPCSPRPGSPPRRPPGRRASSWLLVGDLPVDESAGPAAVAGSRPGPPRRRRRADRPRGRWPRRSARPTARPGPRWPR